MINVSRFGVVVTALVLTVTACGDDPSRPPPEDTGSYQNLTARQHVLTNLQKAHNDRTTPRIDELLDDDFTFYFADSDVGGSIPEQWGRAEELDALTNMFSRTEVDGYPLVRSLRLDILFEGQAVAWDDTVPPSAPSEVWYTVTLFYDFTVEIEPDLTLVPYNGAKCQFTVRNAGTEDAPQWRLVEWRDLGASNLRRLATEEKTWGAIKSIYR